jgi:hypothetical protein
LLVADTPQRQAINQTLQSLLQAFFAATDRAAALGLRNRSARPPPRRSASTRPSRRIAPPRPGPGAARRSGDAEIREAGRGDEIGAVGKAVEGIKAMVARKAAEE